MPDKISVEYFGKIFLEEEDINKVLEEYTKFWKKDICDYSKYTSLSYILNSHRDSLKRDSWKEFVCNSFLDLVDLCKNNGTEDISNRQNLINEICSLLVDTKERLSARFRYIVDTKIKFALLDLMLDVICSYSSKNHKILYPAIIYDMICSMNNRNSDFYEFYGDLAAEEIVDHTRNMLYLFSYSEKENFKEWIQDYLRLQNRELLRNFSKRLLEKEPDFSIKQEIMENDYDKKQSVKKIVFVSILTGVALVSILSISFWSGILYERNTQGRVINEKNVEIESLEKQFQDLKIQDLELEKKNIEFENQIQYLTEDNNENEKKIKKLRKKIKSYEDNEDEDDSNNIDTDKNNNDSNADEKKDNTTEEKNDAKTDSIDKKDDIENNDTEGKSDAKTDSIDKKDNIENNNTEGKSDAKTNSMDKKENITKINTPTSSAIN